MTDSIIDLPKGWIEIKLKELGLTKAQSIAPSDSPNELFELWSVPSYPTEKPEYQLGKDIGSNKIRVEPEDVLLCKINPRINRVWKVEKKNDHTQIASTEWIVFRSESVNSDFLKYRLMEPSVRKEICANVSGVGGSLTRARPQIVKELKVTVAPLNEQRRIADKIEALQTKSKKVKQALDTAKPLLDKLKQSILASAFRGDLTEEWRKKNPDIEPASVLLERIRVERRKKWEENELDKMRVKGKEPKNDKWKSKYKEPEPDEIEDLPDLPEGWCWASLDQLLEYTTSGSRGWAKYYSEGGSLFIRAQNLKFDYLDLKDVAHVSLPEGVEGKRTKLKKHDLLITITGANVTKAGFVEEDIKEAYISQHVALCRLVHPLLIHYIYFFIISSEDGRKQLEQNAYGLGKPGLNLDNIRSVLIPIASYEESKAIVQKIKTEFLLVDSIEKKINACLKSMPLLNQKILEKAFSGKLVLQDPSDEPATNLLKKIRNKEK